MGKAMRMASDDLVGSGAWRYANMVRVNHAI